MKRTIRLTESELTTLIKRIVSETEMQKGEMEEGLFGPGRKEKRENMENLKNQMMNLMDKKGVDESEILNKMEDIIEKAKDYHFKGEVKLVPAGRRGGYIFRYIPELTKMQKFASGSGGLTLGQ